jgi:hypothetical protein
MRKLIALLPLLLALAACASPSEYWRDAAHDECRNQHAWYDILGLMACDDRVDRIAGDNERR